MNVLRVEMVNLTAKLHGNFRGKAPVLKETAKGREYYEDPLKKKKRRDN